MPPAQRLWDQAVRCHRNGQLAEAERLCAQLIRADARHPMPRHLLGDIRTAQGRFDEALTLLSFAVRAMPDNAMAHVSLGNVLLSLARPEQALQRFDRALALAPADSDAWNGRGVALQRLDRPDAAMTAYEHALALAPGHVFTHFNRANLLQQLARHEEALAGYDRVLALMPGHAGAHNNRGWSLLNLRRLEEAKAAFAMAARIAPGDAGARLNRGLLHLLTGDFAEGLPLYEYRKRLAEPVDAGPSGPEWTGAEDIAGKTLFVHHSQGLGDVLQFYRYAAEAAARGARVVFAAPAPLVRLLRSAGAAVEVIAGGTPSPRFDYHIALMSLPRALGLRLETIASAGRYLAAEPERVRHWRARLNPLKIGIAWQGKADMGKRFAPEALARIAALDGVRLISLQKEAAAPANLAMTCFEEMDRGADAFLDSAAILENCDLVITADTAMAHLAGALGVPAWVALKYVPDWRWFLDRQDSPWWSSLRLFRQQKPGDWAGVFAAMEEELRILLKTRQYPPT
jgi:tetratricopeptide (TPR) repeat protein